MTFGHHGRCAAIAADTRTLWVAREATVGDLWLWLLTLGATIDDAMTSLTFGRRLRVATVDTTPLPSLTSPRWPWRHHRRTPPTAMTSLPLPHLAVPVLTSPRCHRPPLEKGSFSPFFLFFFISLISENKTVMAMLQQIQIGCCLPDIEEKEDMFPIIGWTWTCGNESTAEPQR